MFYKKIFLILFVSLFISVFIVSSQIALATDCSGANQANDPACTLPNPLTGVGSPQILIGKVIVAALGVVGSLALLMFIYGGFIWMTAAGNQEMVTRGRNVLIWATIGLIIIFSSYAIVKFVFQGVGAPIT
jgi:hypothetical protein